MPTRHGIATTVSFAAKFFAPAALAFCQITMVAASVPTGNPVAASGKPQAAPLGAADLDTMVQDKRYIELGAALTVGHATLTSAERDYFQGVLESHTNSVASSERLLDRVLPGLRQSGHTTRLLTAFEALAENYARQFKYGQAADTYDALEKALVSAIDTSAIERDRRRIRDDAARYNLLREQAPETVETTTAAGADEVQGRRNPFGLLEMPIAAGGAPNGAPESWVVDTGSTLSVVTRTTAERLHLKVLSGKATTLGVGGGEIPLQVAIIPSLRIGKTVVRNAAVVVFEDAALNIGNPPYQIQGIVGLPILQALGRLTFGPHDRIAFGGSSGEAGPPNLYIENQKPLVAAVTDVGPRLFTFDSGATDTILTERYGREHKSDLLGYPRIDYKVTTADGNKAVPARQAPLVKLEIAGATVSLSQVIVLADQRGNPGTNVFFGNLGQDMLRSFASYTLDFRAMRFTLEH